MHLSVFQFILLHGVDAIGNPNYERILTLTFQQAVRNLNSRKTGRLTGSVL
jgi:hypothetical protein